jgi:putative flippase GtrA
MSEIGRMLRFGIVGVSNTAVTLVTFWLLIRIETPPPAASALAFAAGAANGYRLNRTWTFRVTSGGPRTLARYVGVQALGAALSAAGMSVIASDLPLTHLAAEALVLPVVTMLTYVLSRRVFYGPTTA